MKEIYESVSIPIEEIANYEGDQTLLFFERLNNPEVKKSWFNP